MDKLPALAMQHFFDPGSREDGRFYEAATFLMLHGAGVGKPDKAWMEDQVKKPPTDQGAFY